MILKRPILIALFLSSFFLVLLSVILTLYEASPKNVTFSNALFILFIAQIGSSIFFPMAVGYFYDKIKNKDQAETIWSVFKDLSDGGIIRVYMDREENQHEQNALLDLRDAFDSVHTGRVKLIGVSLRVFFNQTGPFYRSIYKICELAETNDNLKITALVSHPLAPEVYNRAEIETPDRLNDPLINIDIRSTIVSIENLNSNFPKRPIEYGYYSQAPYCTCIIFPDRCYFSPNILAHDAPVRLPMIIFKKDSHGYKKLNQYFDYLWGKKIMDPSAITAKQG